MNRKIAAMAVAAAAMSIGGVTAEAGAFADGNFLYAKCLAGADLCLGYALGIADVLASGSAVNGLTACFTAQMTGEQVRDVVKQFLAAHPQSRHLGAAGLAAHALAQAFPCR